MAYSATNYKKWRSLRMDRRTALALADTTSPKPGAVAAAVANIPTPASATAEDCATKINDLLAKLRTAGYIASS